MDAGAIHPSCRRTIQGGAVQGIGWVLNEEYFMVRMAKYLTLAF